jgi:ribulose-5-phosphate 4-epimerase/fuculose-1-phosphate aldolase
MAQLTEREEICRAGRSLFERRYTHGTTGNISVKVDNGWLFTPTNASLGELDPLRLAHVDAQGALISGDPPTKEAILHMRIYEARPDARAIVHLHSTHSVAVSCLSEASSEDVLPPLTAYYVMRVGRLPLVPFELPGTTALADAVGTMARTSKALLLAHHGPIVAGATLAEAMSAIEELEETARLWLMLQGRDYRTLSEEQVAAVREAFLP